MSCIPLPKAAKPVWAYQLTRLPCVMVNVKLHLLHTLKFSQIRQRKLFFVVPLSFLANGSQCFITDSPRRLCENNRQTLFKHECANAVKSNLPIVCELML